MSLDDTDPWRNTHHSANDPVPTDNTANTEQNHGPPSTFTTDQPNFNASDTPQTHTVTSPLPIYPISNATLNPVPTSTTTPAIPTPLTHTEKLATLTTITAVTAFPSPPLTLSLIHSLGFTESGITKGTFAAWLMSFYSQIPKRSIINHLQRIGRKGFSTSESVIVAILGGLLFGAALGSVLFYTTRGRKVVRSLEGWVLLAALLLPLAASKFKIYVSERIHPVRVYIADRIHPHSGSNSEQEPLLGSDSHAAASRNGGQVTGNDDTVLDLD